MTLTTLTRRVRRAARIIQTQQDLIREQAQFIRDQQAELNRERLEHVREIEGLVCGWLIHIEQPELDMRDNLAALAIMCRNTVARLEEHVL